jgi:DNA-binding beta-propeller fold protein YncE
MRKAVFLVAALLFVTFRVEAQRVPRSLYVENNLGRTLSAIDLESGRIQQNVLTLGQIPNDLLAYRDRLFVVNSQPPEVWVVDVPSRQVTKRIALPEGSNPYQMALVGSRRAYVSLLVANEIAVLNLADGRIEKRIPVGRAPQAILVDLAENRAYVANTGGYPDFRPSSISIIDIRNDSVLYSLPVPENAQALSKGPDYRIYVVCSGKWGANAGKLCILDPWAPPKYEPAIVDTILLGGFPGDVAVTPEGLVFVSDWGDERNGFLYVYDASRGEVIHSATNPIRVGKGAGKLLYDTAENVLYVSNFADDTVQRLDPASGTVLATIRVGDGAHALAITEAVELHDPWADEVVEFTPGSPWSRFGYAFFPDNVLGPPTPSSAVNAYSPSNRADEILSLGHGGQITLAFTDNVVVDEEGPDFTIFENCFISPWIGGPFVEAATVSVSQDGVTWLTFPYDTLTYEGLAGAHPVRDPLHSTDPQLSGGDQFDLAVVGLSWIRYVRITDLGDVWREGPFNGDFDLDAVVAIHSRDEIPSTAAAEQASVPPRSPWLSPAYPNPFNASTRLRFYLPSPAVLKLEILDSRGRLVTCLCDGSAEAGEHWISWDGRDACGKAVPSGIYLARFTTSNVRLCEKLVLMR